MNEIIRKIVGNFKDIKRLKYSTITYWRAIEATLKAFGFTDENVLKQTKTIYKNEVDKRIEEYEKEHGEIKL